MKLTEMKNEQALEALEMLIDPVTAICDEEFTNCLRTGKMMAAVKVALKAHKTELIQILAISEGADPETYRVNMFQIIKKALELLNDPEIRGLFTSAPMSEDGESLSGVSVGENVGAE